VATSFFAELKRRNVIRAGALYAAAAWLLVQIATQVLPFFHTPEWVVRWIVVAAVIGLPLFIVFAWFYEVTPSGLKRQSEVEPAESITHLTARRLDRWIIVLLGFIALLLVVEIFVLRKPAQDAAAQAGQAAVDAPAAANTSAAPAKSIAVLPFENLSKDADNAYFATGMQDEILTRLASIHDLKVISRTSTVQYASRPPNLKIVAEQLGVATVLEGSVQKFGDQVHINLQLIDAHNDSHLWAQSYNRELKDIFAVEAEVAQNVADALKAQLVPAEAARVSAVPTQNPIAYELYLRANSHANRAYDQDVLTPRELPQAITLYQQALDADPQFALASAALARAHMQMYFNAPDRTETRLAAAKTATDHALALQPNLGEAHYALAMYHYWGHRDYAAAIEQLQLARQTLPNSADVVTVLAAIARRQGQVAEMIAGFQQATLLDPRSAFALDQLGLAYSAARRYAEADNAFAQAEAVTREPADERVTRALSAVAWKGDLASLRAALEMLEPGSDAYVGNATSFYELNWCLHDYAAAARTAQANGDAEWSDQNNVVLPRLLYVAWALQANGDADKARETYTLVQKTAGTALLQQPDRAELHLALGFADAGLGLKGEAAREGRRATELLPVSRDALTGSSVQVYLAQIYVRIGDNNSAFDVLRPSMQQLSGMSISSALLKLDPVWDPLRNDPRFAQLRALGEAPVETKTGQ
jgi:serine/threonine-protein kinase